MKFTLGVVMDPIESIHVKKDSTLAILLAAQQRQWKIMYMEQKDLLFRDGEAWAYQQALTVYDNSTRWHKLGAKKLQRLNTLNVILMRKDPPVDTQYWYATQILDRAEKEGVLVFNKPQSLRDVNEKLFISEFPQCCAPTLVTSNYDLLKQFLKEQKDIICKPLHGMGGNSIFRLRQNDHNINVVFETLTLNGKNYMLAQRYIPEIAKGDKRILMIDGKPFPYALARIAPPGETRANLAVGGTGIGKSLSKRDRWICDQVGPALKEKGLFFVGLDIIGDYLTEINVTSPTCIRELEAIYSVSICDQILDSIEEKLAESH